MGIENEVFGEGRVTASLPKRPRLLTAISIITFLGGVLIVVSETAVLAAQSVVGDFSLQVTLLGSTLRSPDVAIFGYLLGLYAIVQAYGFWHLKTWGWWLFIGYGVVRYGSIFIVPQTSTSVTSVLGDIILAILLIYVIQRRSLFGVTIRSSGSSET